jgi:phosphoglycerate dehydrogenase-like enzyme
MLGHPALITCSKGNGAIPLAEHALMLMLMLNRDAMSWVEAQRDKQWKPRFHGELAGLTCGIIGTGNAGRDLALKARACHMNVVGLSRSGAQLEGFDRVYSPSELHTFLPEVDFVVVTTPDTPDTRDMLGEAEFRLMRDSAFYICISRGGIANDAALLTALNNNWIAGAGLDAHAIEPLPQDSPFWDAPNTIVTPHNGATTRQTKARGYEIFRENLKRFVAGSTLTHVVDKSAGY